MSSRIFRPLLPGMAFLVSALAPFAGAQPVQPAATAYLSSSDLTFQALVSASRWSLTVTGPGARVFSREGTAPPSFFVGDLAERSYLPAPDGVYQYRLQALPALPRRTPIGEVPKDWTPAPETDDEGRTSADHRRAESASPLELSGSFTVLHGVIVVPSSTATETRSKAVVAGAPSVGAGPPAAPSDVVTADDQIIQGSLCVGIDCVNNESFGFDTVRLKENNLRIAFDDTSASAGFPANDWQLTANDSASGGANKFSIDDITNSRTPFTVTANAPSNSIFVDSGGRLGLKTSVPVLDVHTLNGNTPAVRLEQDGSSGFTAQTWDFAGNEANFFIRDVTSGSRLPFRIRPGAPTSSLDISASGNVGIGTGTPGTKVEIASSDNVGTSLRVSNTVATTAWDVKNNAATGRLTISDDTAGLRVPIKFAPLAKDNLLRVGVVNTSTVDINGNLTVNGTFTNSSSRDLKNLLAGPDGKSVLAKLADLALFTWSYKDGAGVRHLGPVAEDFFERFGLGVDNKHISPNDMAGVALAATQALTTLIGEKDAEIQALKDRLNRLETRLGLQPDVKN